MSRKVVEYNRPLKVKVLPDEDGFVAKLAQSPKDYYKKLPYGYASTIEEAVKDLRVELASVGINRELVF